MVDAVAAPLVCWARTVVLAGVVVYRSHLRPWRGVLRAGIAVAVAACPLLYGTEAAGQSCLTQAKMPADLRDSIAAAARAFAGDVKSNNSSAAQAASASN